MATWIRTQMNKPGESLVNLDNCETLYIDGAGICAGIPGQGHIALTYFDGPDAERLCQYALIALWGEIKAGVKFIDMSNVCEMALESEEDAQCPPRQ